MGGLIEVMRSGSWLSRERARLWASAALIASLAGLIYILATAHGLSDYQGRPIGTDFSNVYAAGTYVLEGRPEAPFDAPAQHAREREIFGTATPFYGWHYPPFFLFIAALLALLPYLPALAVWQATTLAFYLMSIRAIVGASSPSPRPAGRGEETNLWLLLAAAFPAVFVNLGHGHNGFLTAALIGCALVLLDRRPIARLQTAIWIADPAGADRHRPLENFRCRRGHRRHPRARRHAGLWAEGLARLPRRQPVYARGRA
jgi:hypothetical protein